MANVFDQFDEPVKEPNVFDRFDREELTTDQRLDSLSVTSDMYEGLTPQEAQEKFEQIISQEHVTGNAEDGFTTIMNGERVKIPAPRTSKAVGSGMYDGMNIKEARELYNILSQDPTAEENWFGDLTIEQGGERIVINRPSRGDTNIVDDPIQNRVLNQSTALLRGLTPDFIEEPLRRVAGDDPDRDSATIAVSDKIKGNLQNAAVNTAEFMASIADAAYDGARKSLETIDGVEFEPREGSLTESFNNNVSRYNPQGAIDIIANEAVGMAVGGGPILKALQNSTKIGKFGKLLATEMGMTIPLDDETGTVFVGEDALFSIFGTESEERSPENLKVFTRKMELIGDSILLGTTFDKAADAIWWTSGFLKRVGFDPLRTLTDKEEQAQQIAMDIMDNIDAIGPDMTPQTREKYLTKVADLIDEAQNKYYDTGVEGQEMIKTELDSMSALRQGMKDNPNALSQVEINQGVDPDLARIREENVNSQAVNARNSGMEKTGEKIGRTSKVLERNIDDMAESFGGDPMSDASLQQYQTKTLDRLYEGEQAVARAEQALSDADTAMINTMENDPLFGDMMKKYKADPLTIGKIKNGSSDEIREGLKKVYEIHNKHKNALYDAIPKDAKANKTAFLKVVDENKADLSPSIQKEIDKWSKGDGTYGDLYLNVRKKINREIEALYKAGGRGTPAEIDALKAVRDNIDGAQLEHLKKSVKGAKELEKINAAAEYYAKYADIWVKDLAVGKEIASLDRIATPAQAGYITKQLDAMLRDDNPEVTSQIMELLSENDGNADAVVDYIVGDIGSKLANKANSVSSISDLDITDFVTDMRKVALALEETNPEKFAQVNNFIENVRTANVNKEELQAVIDEARAAQLLTQNDVFNNEGLLRKFFAEQGERTSGTAVINSNTYEVFHKIFEAASPEQLEKLMKGASKEQLDGLKAAYFKWEKEKIFTSDFRPDDSRVVDNANFDDVSKTNKVFNAGKILFKDNPKLMEAHEEILRQAAEMQRNTGKKIPIFGGSISGQAGASMTMIVTQLFGVLDRVGARVRSGAGSWIRSQDPSSSAARIHDALLADPNKLVNEIRKLSSKQNPTFGPEEWKFIRQLAVRSGMYSDPDDPELIESINAVKEEYQKEKEQFMLDNK